MRGLSFSSGGETTFGNIRLHMGFLRSLSWVLDVISSRLLWTADDTVVVASGDDFIKAKASVELRVAAIVGAIKHLGLRVALSKQKRLPLLTNGIISPMNWFLWIEYRYLSGRILNIRGLP